MHGYLLPVNKIRDLPTRMDENDETELSEAEAERLRRLAREEEFTIAKAIGARVRKLRDERDWSRKKLEHAIGLGDGLYKYETGARRFSLRHLVRLTKVFRVSLYWLVEGVEEDETAAKQPRNLQDVRAALAPLGVRVELSPTVPEPILQLLNTGWIKDMTNVDITHLRVHLATGGGTTMHDLQVALWLGRCQDEGSDENLRAANDAIRKRNEARSIKRETGTERALLVPNSNDQSAVADERPKRLPLKSRKRKRKRPPAPTND